MHSYSSSVMNARTGVRQSVDTLHSQSCAVDDGSSAASIVNEICSAAGIVLFAAALERVIAISQPVGWSLALVTALILAETVANRLKLAFSGSLVALLFAVAVFGAAWDASQSLPAAVLITVAANLFYLVRFKTSFVTAATSLALTGIYVAASGATPDLALVSLVAACLLQVVEIALSHGVLSARLAPAAHR